VDASQVPIINFSEHFMSITSIIMSACSLRMQPLFDLLYFVLKLVPCLLCLQRGLICFRSARSCIIFSLLCSISTSLALREAAPSSTGRFVDAAADEAACHACTIATQSLP